MKFLTSSSSSSASSTITTNTATSFDPSVHNARNATPGGCIARVFRRLLCLNNLPTHPSDHHFRDTDRDPVSVELDRLQCGKAEEKIEGSAAPSIVAKLMGIDSFPETDFSALQKSPNSIARSRSMNSVELMKELASIQGRHRRVKSFRETPTTFVELQDENFFILSFENADGIGKLGAKSRISEMCSAHKQTKQRIKGENSKSTSNKRRESVYEKNKENHDSKTVSNENPADRGINSRIRGDRSKLKDSSNILRPTNRCSRNSPVGKEPARLAKPISQKPELQLGRRRMKNRKDDCLPVNKTETESDSENSSPSSVLDIMKFPGDPEVTSSTEELSRLTNSKSRRTLAEDLENYRKQYHQCNEKIGSTTSNTSCKSRPPEWKNIEQRKENYHGGGTYEIQIWGETIKMAGKNTVQSKWIHHHEGIQTFEEYKEICGHIERQILDEMVGEIVAQLVLLTQTP